MQKRFVLINAIHLLPCSCSSVEVESMAGFVETLVGLVLVVFAVVAVIGFIFLCELPLVYVVVRLAIVYNPCIAWCVCVHIMI